MAGLYTTAQEKFNDVVKLHPCFSEEAHCKYGIIHLPVSPKCNIQCKFCRRSINKYENRPGVAGKILTPEEAVNMVERALELYPDITVAGIAGPGDTLATPHALDTFEMIHERFPELINCLSTNGLMLKENVERMVQVGVKTVTVTVNAVYADLVQKVNSYIIYNRRYITDKEGALWLLLAQLAGIDKAARAGLLVKINTVLIPGINEDHVGEIARVTAGVGASMMNVIPLIPQNEMKEYRPPTTREIDEAVAAAEKYLPVFRHCQQCRADACGIPGSGVDLAEVLYRQPAKTFSHG